MSEDQKKMVFPQLSQAVPILAPDYRIVYSNTSRMAITPWDLRIVFSQVIGEAGSSAIQDEVTVLVSPQHAKALLENWKTTLAQYEATFGEIADVQAILKKTLEGATSKVAGPKKRSKPSKRPASSSGPQQPS